MGRGQQVDELEVAMNRAAEAAVPLAQELLTNAVKSMSVNDAKNILAGGDTSVTDFFAEKTRTPLAARFLPVVTRATEKVGLAEKYNRVAGKVAGIGLVHKEDAAIEPYVTRKSLDGLYAMIGEEERKIRQDPAGSGSAEEHERRHQDAMGSNSEHQEILPKASRRRVGPPQAP